MSNEGVKKRNLTITSMAAVLLAATTVAVSFMILTTSDNAFARNERYGASDSSQAAAVSNSCLNPIFDSNTIDNAVGVGNCAGTVSQQAESGQASTPITHQSANPSIELQRATTTQPPLTGTPPTVGACVGCFDDVLNAEQQTTFEEEFTGHIPGVTTIEELCTFLQNIHLNGGDPIETLNAVDSVLNLMEETGDITQSIRLR